MSFCHFKNVNNFLSQKALQKQQELVKVHNAGQLVDGNQHKNSTNYVHSLQSQIDKKKKEIAEINAIGELKKESFSDTEHLLTSDEDEEDYGHQPSREPPRPIVASAPSIVDHIGSKPNQPPANGSGQNLNYLSSKLVVAVPSIPDRSTKPSLNGISNKNYLTTLIVPYNSIISKFKSMAYKNTSESLSPTF